VAAQCGEVTYTVGNGNDQQTIVAEAGGAV